MSSQKETHQELIEHLNRALRGFTDRDMGYACAVWHGEDSDGCGQCLSCIQYEIDEARKLALAEAGGDSAKESANPKLIVCSNRDHGQTSGNYWWPKAHIEQADCDRPQGLYDAETGKPIFAGPLSLAENAEPEEWMRQAVREIGECCRASQFQEDKFLQIIRKHAKKGK